MFNKGIESFTPDSVLIPSNTITPYLKDCGEIKEKKIIMSPLALSTSADDVIVHPKQTCSVLLFGQSVRKD